MYVSECKCKILKDDEKLVSQSLSECAVVFKLDAK